MVEVQQESTDSGLEEKFCQIVDIKEVLRGPQEAEQKTSLMKSSRLALI